MPDRADEGRAPRDFVEKNLRLIKRSNRGTSKLEISKETLYRKSYSTDSFFTSFASRDKPSFSFKRATVPGSYDLVVLCLMTVVAGLGGGACVFCTP